MSASKARKIVELYRAIEARDEEIARLRDGPWIGQCQACGHQHEARRPQPLTEETRAALDRKDAEIARLRAALAKANSQAEHFEREWYLRGDVLEQARGALQKTMGAWGGTCAWHADVKAAISAIDAGFKA